ncbi:hypothetical protein CKM354_000113800 [Cercospora kikuchii]|uniref:Flavin-containing monooxygenase n=1 Tax=Cercospora kikuchii TaxID=84275 RepID=A0A9P3F8F9_9PEZI|nr:uncharacterized protein CKM354_000113800 [Cercospora kikuchii]GIZ37698.1 hypothetical protein CKM354_000113800 [Cercospora kikuchii]
MAPRPHVVIIGAGVSGLAAASYLCAEGLRVTVLEQKRGPGGLWNPQTGKHWAKPVYNTLETNIARQLMTFSDHPWDPTTPLHAHNSHVNDYLRQYAATLRQKYAENLTFIFNCRVVTAQQVNNLMTATWEINVQPVDRRLKFDTKNPLFSRFLVVAAGNYHNAFRPDYLGAPEWEAQDFASIFHAQDFKKPEMYKNKNVLIIGHSASGFDISMQIAPFAKNVVVSTQRPNQQLASGVHITVGAVENFKYHQDRTINFEGGASFSNVDKVIYCTGYRYDFNFLKGRDGTTLIPSQSSMVSNLYQHIFYMPNCHVENNSLAFVGLLQQGLSFTIAEAQSALVARAFAGRVGIPTRNGQQGWYAQNLQDRNVRLSDDMSATMIAYHKLKDMGKQYVNELWGLSKNAQPQSNGFEGKRPPYWCGCFDQARALARDARPKFKALSAEQKKTVMSFEDAFGKGCFTRCPILPDAATDTNMVSCYL